MQKRNIGEYRPGKIEKKWQQEWRKSNLYRVDRKKGKKHYILVELTYSSGDLHLGHWFAWSAPDAYARFKRMQGANVLFPVGGFDSFGLPAENAAIKQEIHPSDWTNKNIRTMRKQFATLGPSFDWESEVITSDPRYYKWTQWLFLQLFKAGLAYRAEVTSNWCPKCKTVLANEHVVNGCCWRHTETQVEQKKVDQWLFRITKYADKLIWPKKLKVNWPASMVEAQNNWIGRSEGVRIEFKIQNSKFKIPVFTTRADTLFGATFVILAPELPLVQRITKKVYRDKVTKYIRLSKKKLERERLTEVGDKTGVFTGAYAVNPANGEKIPIWVAEFVIMEYGTGAIMGVPAHDERDFEFAKKYKLEIKPVVIPERDYEDSNAKSYYKKRSKIHKSLLLKLAKEAFKARKKMIVHGGWAVFLHTGIQFRDFEDLDLIIKENELSWWKKTLLSEDLKISNMFPEGKNPKYYFQATKKDTHVDVLTIRAEKGKSVVWLGGETPEVTKYSFEDVFEKKTLQGIPVFVARKDYLYMWKVERVKNEIRWKEQADFLFMGYRSYESQGKLINSGKYSGMKSEAAIEKIIKDLEKKKLGKQDVQYHLRDWTISRQRYWGAPIPIIYCRNCFKNKQLETRNTKRRLKEGIDYAVFGGKEYMVHPVPEKDLPVKLPYKVDYTPTGKAPLATAPSFVNTSCPECGGKAMRETETMDTYVDSSWYFLRYPDPDYDKGPFNPSLTKKWLPLDIYFGGPEHILGHTLYARFITKVLHDLGFLPFDEFAKVRRNHGVILGPDGFRMSKSRGNVVNPDAEVVKYGADSVRLFLCFLGPHDKGGPWSREGIEGMHRFLGRVWRLVTEYKDLVLVEGNDAKEVMVKQHQTVKKVSEDIEKLHFNTAIAAIMEFLNLLREKAADADSALSGSSSTRPREAAGGVRSATRTLHSASSESQINKLTNHRSSKMRCAEWDEALSVLVQLLAPFAPHITEEVWVNILGEKFSIHTSNWPKYKKELVKEETVTIVVQVDGRLRATLNVSRQKSKVKSEVVKLSKGDSRVKKWLKGKKIKATVFIEGKLVNFVTNP